MLEEHATSTASDRSLFPQHWTLVVPAGWALTAVLYPVLRVLDAPVTLGLAYALALLFTVGPLVWAFHRNRVASARIGLVWSWRVRWIAVTLLGFALLGQLWVPLEWLLGLVGVPMLWPNRAAAMGAASVLGWSLVVLVAVLAIPILEEVLFRGHLLAHLRAHAMGTRAAVVLTALLFAVTHIALGPGLVVFTFPFGLFVGWLTVRTGSILYACLLHVLNNAWAHVGVVLLFG